MSSDFVDQVFDRVPEIGDLPAVDQERFKLDVSRLCEEGWTSDEVVRWARLTEEVDPGIPEDEALRRIDEVAAAARKRIHLALIERVREHMADLHVSTIRDDMEKEPALMHTTHKAIAFCDCQVAKDYRAVKALVYETRRKA